MCFGDDSGETTIPELGIRPANFELNVVRVTESDYARIIDGFDSGVRDTELIERINPLVQIGSFPHVQREVIQANPSLIELRTVAIGMFE